MAESENIIGAYELLTIEEANLVDEFAPNPYLHRWERDRLANLILRARRLSPPPATRAFLKEWVRAV
jgi:hypothetical protein